METFVPIVDAPETVNHRIPKKIETKRKHMAITKEPERDPELYERLPYISIDCEPEPK